jgi:hypothetical protein
MLGAQASCHQANELRMAQWYSPQSFVQEHTAVITSLNVYCVTLHG